MLRPQSKLLAS